MALAVRRISDGGREIAPRSRPRATSLCLTPKASNFTEREHLPWIHWGRGRSICSRSAVPRYGGRRLGAPIRARAWAYSIGPCVIRPARAVYYRNPNRWTSEVRTRAANAAKIWRASARPSYDPAQAFLPRCVRYGQAPPCSRELLCST